MSLDLSGKQVLVTGATGFIGGRLLETLVLDRGAKVRALTTGYARAVRIARFDTDIVLGDVTNPDDVKKAVQGCSFVFHCAHGNTGDEEWQRRVNVEGTRNLLEASRAAGVKRVVHVSTMAVYGNPGDGDLDETAPRGSSGDVYGESKLEAEIVAEEFGNRGLPVVIVQPTVVYGPFGPAWTQRVLDRLRSQRVVLVDGGKGLCNAVYVDDVVDALLLSATRPGVEGESFLISASEATTWRDFYGAFERMLGRKCTVSISCEEAKAHAKRGAERKGSFVKAARALVREPDLRRAMRGTWAGSALIRMARPLASRWSPPLPGKGKRTVSDAPRRADATTPRESERPIQRLSVDQVDAFRARTHVRIDKARRLLGYEPRFDLERGMALTEAWARWANLLGTEEG
jgi:nucleoside-diphosphate-sugar epimerase